LRRLEVFDARDAEAGLAAYVAHGQTPPWSTRSAGAPGSELTRRILRHDHRRASSCQQTRAIFAARNGRAQGYVTKNDDPYLLLRALREVMAGGTFIMRKSPAGLGADDSGAKIRSTAKPARTGDLRMLGEARPREIADATRLSYKNHPILRAN